MTTKPLRSITPTIDVYVKLAQFPILADRIRMRMREELFRRGVIGQADFEREVQELAIESQRREGVIEPYTQEETEKWELRKEEFERFTRMPISPTAWALPCWNRLLTRSSANNLSILTPPS